jgi:hypothetical protein
MSIDYLWMDTDGTKRANEVVEVHCQSLLHHSYVHVLGQRHYLRRISFRCIINNLGDDSLWGVEDVKKEEVLKILGARCMRCGYSEFKECLDLHHIIPRFLGGSDSINNLLILCACCHRSLHLAKWHISELGIDLSLFLSEEEIRILEEAWKRVPYKE